MGEDDEIDEADEADEDVESVEVDEGVGDVLNGWIYSRVEWVVWMKWLNENKVEYENEGVNVVEIVYENVNEDVNEDVNDSDCDCRYECVCVCKWTEGICLYLELLRSQQMEQKLAQ